MAGEREASRSTESDHLSTLPLELFELIRGQLPNCALRELCLTSKLLCERTRPALYSVVRMIWHAKSKPPVRALFRTFLRRPDLASLVQHVIIIGTKWWSSSPGTIWPAWMHLTGALLRQIWAHVRIAQLAEPLEWYGALSHGDVDALIGLLLSALPNLRSCNIALDFQSKFIFLAMKTAVTGLHQQPIQSQEATIVGAFPSVQLQPFSKLRYFRFKWPKDLEATYQHAPVAEQLPYLFYVPAIRRIEMILPVFERNFQWPFPDPPRAGSLRSLDLRDTHAQLSTLLELLKRTPNLERLKYEIVIVDDGEETASEAAPDADPEVNKPDIQILHDALWFIRNSLQELYIKVLHSSKSHRLLAASKKSTESNHHMFRKFDMFPSLRDFDKLEILVVPIAFLVGCSSKAPKIPTNLEEGLPSSLRYLELREDIVDTDELVQWNVKMYMRRLLAFLRFVRFFQPHLIAFGLDVPHYPLRNWTTDDLVRLRDACEDVGIGHDIHISIDSKAMGEASWQGFDFDGA